jgi:penicillin-binding protein 1A
VQILGRLVKTAAIAGALLALGLMILIPDAKAFTGSWKTTRGDALEQMTELSERSVVYGRDGNVLGYRHADENRAPIKLSQVPQTVIKAVVGVEDDRFWKHHGIDLRGTFRALATNVQAGEVRQGGSTITQQLVKNSLLTPEKTVDRKVREALLAWRIEDHNTKKQILERYLNTVYFGNGAYGVQAAAEVYFGKKASQLDEADAVLLAGLIRNPVGYDPIKFPDAAVARRRVVVDRLVTEGVISAATRDRVLARPLPRAVKSLQQQQPNNDVIDRVTQELLEDHRLGETKAERYNAIFKGGLRIYTTLDPALGRDAHEAVDTIVPNTGGKFVAALASVEPSTGAVRAIVGGDVDEPGKHRFNLATQSHRQPGSSFKAMVLVAALREGYGPATMVDGTSPCTVKFPGNPPYELENAEGEGGGVMPLSEATADSINCAYVRLASVVGLDKIAEAAKDMGITSELRVLTDKCKCLTPAMAIGGLDTGVSPLEMASAYATLANDGVFHKPYFIEKVLDRHGKVLFRGASKGEQKVSVQVARQAVSILRGVVTGGTGTRANPGKWPTFGKTGTTQDYTDGWFVGSTRQLTAAVWMGSPVGKVPMRNVGGIKVFGGTYPARVFGQFMRTAMAGRPALAFPAPDPRQIGNKQMKLSPTATTGVTDTSLGDIQIGEPGVTIGDSNGDGKPDKPPKHTTTTVDNSPPSTQYHCEEPEDWDPQKMGGPFCPQNQ